jgi:hypothetical protein
MIYVTIIAAGIASGLLTTRRLGSAYSLAGVSILALGVAVGLMLILSYSGEQLTGTLRLDLDPKLDPTGLLPLLAVGYAAMVGAIVAALRLLFTKKSA